MAHLIDKDALVKETERRMQKHHSGYLVCLNDILSFLDTLEVKEVDLGKAYDDFLESHKNKGYMLFEVAKHFFELGLKAQKGE